MAELQHIPRQNLSGIAASKTQALAARGLKDLGVTEEAEQWVKKGEEFRREQRWDDAFACFECGIQLDPNHPELQFLIGFSYHAGQGIPQDYVQAAVWFHKAALQGNSGAQNNLGSLYCSGQGVHDDTQGSLWYGLWEHPSPPTQGVYHFSEAVYWYREAANQGNSYAQTNLGLLYERGQGVPKDYTQARYWYRKAAAQGNGNAKDKLSLIEAEDRRHEAATDKAAEEFAKDMKRRGTVRFHGGGESDPLVKTANEVFAKATERKVP